jgi:hypothetical protein
LPIIDKSVLQISEVIDVRTPFNCDYFLQDQDFQNGKICKFEKSQSDSSREEDDPSEDSDEEPNEYKLWEVDLFTAMKDLEDSNLEECDREEDIPANDSFVWISANNERKNLLSRYGAIARKPSSFPRIDQYEPEDLLRKCKEIDYCYHRWINNYNLGELSDQESNQIKYLFLRYPNLEKMFIEMDRQNVSPAAKHR